MKGLSQLRRGRSLLNRAKRARLRRRQPRFAGKLMRSEFKAAPRIVHSTQPYLGAGLDVSELLR